MAERMFFTDDSINESTRKCTYSMCFLSRMSEYRIKITHLAILKSERCTQSRLLARTERSTTGSTHLLSGTMTN